MLAQGWTPPYPCEEALHALSSQEGILLPASSHAAPQQDLLGGTLGGCLFAPPFPCRAHRTPMEEPLHVFRP